MFQSEFYKKKMYSMYHGLKMLPFVFIDSSMFSHRTRVDCTFSHIHRIQIYSERNLDKESTKFYKFEVAIDQNGVVGEMSADNRESNF